MTAKIQKKQTDFNTLAQLRKGLVIEPPRDSKKTLLKRARTKFITNNVALKLADLNSELKQSYFNTFHCVENLVQSGDKITGKYCNNRWCLTCNRIRTAKLINGYKEPLSKLKDKQFVTLTIPNVSGKTLKKTLSDMIKTFKEIKDTLRKRETPITGIRKLEVTYNAARNDFHPHFHLVISGHQVGKDIITEWLKRYPEANILAQDIRPADNNSVMELFKYFTKIVTKGSIYISALDTIFKSMRGMRVFQPMGIKKDVSEEIEELISEIYEDLEKIDAVWTWIENDWIDKNTGETLTGYIPSDNVLNILNIETIIKPPI